MTTTRTVLVSAGTYHLPFHRLVDWMRPWVAEHDDVRVIMQHGPSRQLEGAENRAMVPYDELLVLMSTADVVVLQGGAGGVMDARSLGRIPILVPRVPVDDEVVDDHQLVFSHTVAELGLAHRAITAAELWRLLDGALAGTVATRGCSAAVTEGVREFERLLSSLPVALPRSARLRRLAGLAASVVAPGSRRGPSARPAASAQHAPDDVPRGVDSEA